MYKLKIPTDGFSEFYTYRYAYEDEIEIIIGEDAYLFTSLDELRIWMKNVGVPKGFIDKFLDLIWNWRLIHYTISTGHLHFPRKQSHPLEHVSKDIQPFKVPRSTRERDIFDPLQDPKKHDFS